MSVSLSQDQLDEFRATGVLVIEGVLSPEEVSAARQAFHVQLKTIGMDHDALLRGEQSPDAGARIKSPVSRIFYPDWKLLNVHLHPRVCQLVQQLLVKTYGSSTDADFLHPFGPFQHVRAYVDRVCYRLPDHIREEGGLGLHLDRNPVDPYLFFGGRQSHLIKWRPIQAFVALTDQYGGESGGLRVVPGFHHRINEYFNGKSSEGGGEFYRMNSAQHHKLQRECRPVDAPAGALVLWDNRLPHATASKLQSHDTREVVYTGFLPDVPLNQAYIRQQLEAMRNNAPPPAYVEDNKHERSDRNWKQEQLSQDQAGLLGIDQMRASSWK